MPCSVFSVYTSNRQDELELTNVATELQDVMMKGLIRSEKNLPGKSFKATLAAIIGGKLDKSPFAKDLLDEIRTDIRLALKKHGYGDGLPREGDRVQHFEVRLIQSALWAFGDPDALFGDFWGKGVWIGSQSRRLPRTPSVFDRKVK